MNYNGKKSNTISGNKRKNMELAKVLDKTQIVDTEQMEHTKRLIKNLRRCACPSLYGTGMVFKQTTYHGSIRCNSKCCFVCNFARQKQVRKRYATWFKDNKTILLIKNEENGKVRYATITQQQDKYTHWKIVSQVEYDLMHLTLTLPHLPTSGWNDQKYYFDEIANLFHRLRNKNEYFKNNVLGGEYGIECTNPENLHIHIHSLLMVKRKGQNRNLLHLEILREWNRISVNKQYDRACIDKKQYKSIHAGNKLLTDEYVSKLNPKGSTIIGLETIYTLNSSKEKVRSYQWNDAAMIQAVMETISYHFSPTAFNKADKSFNLDLLIELQPVLYKKQLYRKFGVLHGEKSLNIKTASEGMEFDPMLHEDLLIDEDTGEILSEEPKQFYILSPAFVYHDPTDDYKIHLSREGMAKSRTLTATSSKGAMVELREMIKKSYQLK